jgi:hypothetical protein
MSFGSGNPGFGSSKPRPPPVETPLWKLQQEGHIRPLDTKNIQTKEDVEREKKLEEDSAANNLFDAVSSPLEDPTAKPMARHVLIKDLRKVAAKMKIALPNGGLFANRAPISLFAMFDGQFSSDDGAGAVVAEWCARQAHAKLLSNLASLPSDLLDEKITAGLVAKTMEDLDNDLRANQQQVCGAVVVLMVGNRVFTIALGFCGGLLSLSAAKANAETKSNLISIRSQQSQEREAMIRGKGGSATMLPGLLGSEQGKINQPIPAPGGLLRFLTEVRCFPITWERNPFALMASAPVMQRLPEADLIKVAQDFEGKPRAICGEIVAMALKKAPSDGSQCTAVAIFFRASKASEAGSSSVGPSPPPAKKAKTSGQLVSVRLRHIMMKHRKCSEPKDPVRSKDVTRTEFEAETIIRGALGQLQREVREAKVPADPKKAAAAFLQPSPTFIKLCKELSECSTAKNGGGMLGDMGWLSEAQLSGFGPVFAETGKTLQVGQWSDLVPTAEGIHIIQKIA